MLAIVSEDQANKLYVLKVKASSNDFSSPKNTVGAAGLAIGSHEIDHSLSRETRTELIKT